MTKSYDFAPTRGLFITGTDTGVGKTLVTGAIARCLYQSKMTVGVFKPIATGCQRQRQGLVSTDAEFLAHCAEAAQPLELINPVTYAEPLAPSVAAQRTKRPIDWPAIQQAYRLIAQSTDLLLVEGIGGVMVPIQPHYFVIDLMVDIGLPVLIVASAKLGTINHTLLTVELCRARGLKIAGIVINGYDQENATLAQETNPAVIAENANLNVLTVIPYDTDTSVEQGRLGSDALAAVQLVDWPGLIQQAS